MEITSKDMQYFSQARNIAELSTFNRVHVGCVIVYHNKVISTGCNRDRTDPLQRKYNRARNIPEWSPHKVHAEVDAIKHVLNLDINWKNAAIYIYRIRRDQPFGMARPCKSCMELIKDLGIRHIYYTSDDGYVYERIET